MKYYRADLLPALKGGGSHREHPPPSHAGFIGQVGVIGHGQKHPQKEVVKDEG